MVLWCLVYQCQWLALVAFIMRGRRCCRKYEEHKDLVYFVKGPLLLVNSLSFTLR